ncbi:MAG: DUF2608 domain-containing protein [Chlamydiia bacterium]|nr:DUF2608 domain-containing protein [Chlamydiia bacterium]
MRQGKEPHEALEMALSEWMAVQNISKMKLVEPSAAEIVRSLQEAGYTVMGLTTRGLGQSTRTNEQLKTVGIDLSRTAPANEDIFFMNGRGVLFRGGTLFTANTHKGKALFTFLDEAGYKPQRILFINDKRSHILPIEEWADQRGVPFIGLRYGFLDEKVKNLNLEITEIQWEHFGHILSDAEAQKIGEERKLRTCPAG